MEKPVIHNSKGNFRYDYFVSAIVLLAIILMTILLLQNARASEPKTPKVITSIYWSDADSGQLNGNIKFRLNGVDAPETGGVGAAIGGAKCEQERELGFEAKQWIVEQTSEAKIEVAKVYSNTTHGRIVVDLSINGDDLGKRGLEEGVLKPWPHKGSKALLPKPTWCSSH